MKNLFLAIAVLAAALAHADVVTNANGVVTEVRGNMKSTARVAIDLDPAKAVGPLTDGDGTLSAGEKLITTSSSGVKNPYSLWIGTSASYVPYIGSEIVKLFFGTGLVPTVSGKTVTVALDSAYSGHVGNSDIHVTASEKSTWSGKQNALDSSQLAAANSGVTSTKVSGYDAHVADGTVHVTASDKSMWSAKQSALSDAQLAAANSGITSTKVATYDGYATSKQNALSDAQLAAANSGVTSTKVSGYDAHVADGTVHVTASDKSTWSAKQSALSATQLSAVNSGVTSSKVSAYDGYGQSIVNLGATKADVSNVYTKAEIELVVLRNLVNATITNHLSNLTWDSGHNLMWKKMAVSGCFYERAYTNVNVLITGGVGN